jgi:multidrug efflux system membrane fusion protein
MHIMSNRWIYSIFSLFLAALFTSGCEQPPVTVVEVVRPVRYMQVVPVGSAETRIFSGVTKAAVETDLSFKVGGLLTELQAGVGDNIAAGQLVARIEPTDYEVTLREAQAGLERSRAEERNAQAGFERTRELYENRNASRSDLDTARAMAESAGAQVRASSQQLEGARLQLSYAQLKSPQQCTIARRYVEVNQNVSAGQPIVRVNCGGCAEIRVDVPGVYIGQIETGKAAKVKVAALPGQQLDGIVTEVGVGTDQNRSIYPVVVQLQNGCAAVRSGMAADVALVLAFKEAAGSSLLVPIVSVGEDRDGNFVFVLESQANGEQFVARRRAVTVGQPMTEGLQIEAGLTNGELIATAGVRRLIDGQVVTLLEGSGSRIQ